jgi:tRNA dimethylallyltransferase
MILSELFNEIDNFLKTSESDNKKPLIVILGPTASGKTGLSIALAKKYNGEIISVDSRQVYKYMDIGTAKITKEEMQGIKHYLIDIIKPDETFNLADFLQQARYTTNQILMKGKIPFLVGGTGLYISALIENYKIVSANPDFELRKKLEGELKKFGPEYLYNKLQKIDPKSAERIHPNNIRYVFRALEINLTTQKQKKDEKGDEEFAVFKIGIEWPRELLYEKINKRVDEQIDRGLVNEVKTLLEMGYKENMPSMSGIGYKEIIPYIKGECSLDEAKEILKQHNRNYAKRQITWFGRYKDIFWVDYKELDKASF